MELTEIRKWIIISMFSDDVLFDELVLKGGNALNIVHKLGHRSSLDIDFSIDSDFEDLEDTKSRIFAALKDRFESAGYAVFDERLLERPSDAVGKWGGYSVEFKLIRKELLASIGRDRGAIRRQAELSGPLQQKTFRIQISKFEFCRPKEEVELEGYTVVVYTPEMIAIEKIRAICQQMDEYLHRAHKTARGRDFYDVFATIEGLGIDLTAPENVELLRNIFEAKDVPPRLLEYLPRYREFHRQDWPSVADSVAGELQEFDFYFDYVLGLAQKLKSLWME